MSLATMSRSGASDCMHETSRFIGEVSSFHWKVDVLIADVDLK